MKRGTITVSIADSEQFKRWSRALSKLLDVLEQQQELLPDEVYDVYMDMRSILREEMAS